MTKAEAYAQAFKNYLLALMELVEHFPEASEYIPMNIVYEFCQMHNIPYTCKKVKPYPKGLKEEMAQVKRIMAERKKALEERKKRIQENMEEFHAAVRANKQKQVEPGVAGGSP